MKSQTKGQDSIPGNTLHLVVEHREGKVIVGIGKQQLLDNNTGMLWMALSPDAAFQVGFLLLGEENISTIVSALGENPC